MRKTVWLRRNGHAMHACPQLPISSQDGSRRVSAQVRGVGRAQKRRKSPSKSSSARVVVLVRSSVSAEDTCMSPCDTCLSPILSNWRAIERGATSRSRLSFVNMRQSRANHAPITRQSRGNHLPITRASRANPTIATPYAAIICPRQAVPCRCDWDTLASASGGSRCSQSA